MFSLSFKRNKIKLIYFVVFLLSILLGFIMFDKVLMPLFTRKNFTKPLPNMIGVEYDKAVDSLKKIGLNPVKIGEEYSKDYKAGSIIWQIPEGGRMVKSGRKVRLAISKGTEKMIIPELKGISFRQAKIQIERLGLKLGKIEYENSSEVLAENVISTLPQAQSQVSKGDTINVKVSLGIESSIVVVPSFVGYPSTELPERVPAVGLQLGEIKVRKIPSVKPGTVFQQSLYSGEKVNRWTTIDFIVNEGVPENE